MRSFKLFFLLVFAGSIEVANADMKCLMEAPLITGASISAGLDGTSFGDQLAERYHSEKRALHEAYAGVTGETITGYPSFARGLKNASIVIALDFFYWDQQSCGSPDWEANLNKTIDFLFKNSVEKGIPLVVGNLAPAHEPFNRIKFNATCGPLIDQKLKERCGPQSKKCLLVDNAELEKSVESYFEAKVAVVSNKDRAMYARTHITRDGIHPRTDAYTAIADYLDQLIQNSAIQCK